MSRQFINKETGEECTGDWYHREGIDRMSVAEFWGRYDLKEPPQEEAKAQREEWVRNAALKMKCAHIAAGSVLAVSDAVICVAVAKLIYDGASKE